MISLFTFFFFFVSYILLYLDSFTEIFLEASNESWITSE